MEYQQGWHMPYTQVCHFKRPYVTLSDLVKYSMTPSITWSIVCSLRQVSLWIIIIIIITTTMFMMLSSWQSHCESSPGSFDECRMAPSGRWPKTKLDELGCESACTGCQKLHPSSPLLLLSPKADTHFTVPQTVEGWVDLAGWLHTEMVYPSTEGNRAFVTHPSTNRVWRSATTLIEANALPISRYISQTMQYIAIVTMETE